MGRGFFFGMAVVLGLWGVWVALLASGHLVLSLIFVAVSHPIAWAVGYAAAGSDSRRAKERRDG